MNKKRISLIVLIIGLITLVVGVVFLIVRLTAKPGVADGEYLVSVGEWKEKGDHCDQAKCAEGTKCLGPDGEPAMLCNDTGVIWNFTEVGKGTLTTNNHTNDYDFIWAIEDDKLKIETEWLYTLNNEYEYELDQAAQTLVLKNGSDEIKFTPLRAE